MKKKALFIISSLTGNAYRIARPMEDTLTGAGFDVEEMTAQEFLALTSSVNEDTVTVNDNFWDDYEDVGQMKSKTIKNYQNKQEIIPPADLYVVCFWCRRGNLDDLSMRVVSKLYSKNTILAGTMGASLDREYGRKVPLTIWDYASKYTNLIGVYVCQGKIDEKRTEKRRKLPVSDRHYLDEEGYKRHLESRSHPDQTDIFNACQFVLNTSSKV